MKSGEKLTGLTPSQVEESRQKYGNNIQRFLEAYYVAKSNHCLEDLFHYPIMAVKIITVETVKMAFFPFTLLYQI